MIRIVGTSVFSGATALAIALAAGACSKTEATDRTSGPAAAAAAVVAAAVPSGVVAIPIAVNENGFSPNTVNLKKGSSSALVFTRTSEQTCATEVAFPEIHLKKELPLHQPVVVQVPTDQARRLTFQCGMGMYKSTVVID